MSDKEKRELLVDFAKTIQKWKNKGLEFSGVVREVDYYLENK